MRRLLFCIIAFVMTMCASVNVYAEATSVINTPIPPDTTVITDTCLAASTSKAKVGMTSFSHQEISSKMMCESSHKKDSNIWNNSMIDWCKNHLFLTGLIGNLLVVLLLWGLYRLIYLFM